MEFEDFQTICQRKHQERKEWLQSLKDGDSVCLYRSGWGTPHYDLLLVKRTTPTQIVCTQILQRGFAVEVKYRKEDGMQVGSDSYAKIEPITDQVRTTNRRYFLENWFAGLSRKELSTECLEAMYEAYASCDNEGDEND
jgi:hypothetical protein